MKKRKITVTVFILLVFILLLSWSAFAYESTLGDVNGDKQVTASDARAALRFAAMIEQLNKDQQKAADLDFDGKVTASDARLILRVAAKIENLPETPTDPTEKPEQDRSITDLTYEEKVQLVNLVHMNCESDFSEIQKLIETNDIISGAYEKHIQNLPVLQEQYDALQKEYNRVEGEALSYIDSVEQLVAEIDAEYKRKAENAATIAYQNVMASGGTAPSSIKKSSAEKAYKETYANVYSQADEAIAKIRAESSKTIEQYQKILITIEAQMKETASKIDVCNYYIEKCERDYAKNNEMIQEHIANIVSCIKYLLTEDHNVTVLPETDEALINEFIKITEELTNT